MCTMSRRKMVGQYFRLMLCMNTDFRGAALKKHCNDRDIFDKMDDVQGGIIPLE